MECDYLIVGAGFYGSVMAERIATQLNKQVLVIDRREHIGGNCYSHKDPQTGIECHKYGTHIFHTSSEKAMDYISGFMELNGYTHQVLTMHIDKVYQMPINLETINAFYKASFSPSEAEAFIKSEADKEEIGLPKNLEEQAIKLIGRPLYEAFIKNYTAKQWGKDPKDLPAKIVQRLPVRFNYDETYFKNARWQGIPMGGYTSIFERLLDSDKITVKTGCDYFEYKDKITVKEKTIYTGPIDKYFGHCHGQLEWRSLNFKRKVFDIKDFQGTSVMNYADKDVAHTRTHEFKHLHPERNYTDKQTVVHYETPVSNNDEPYYPVNDEKNQAIYQKYRQMADENTKIIIGGRLGDYAYYDMDKTILAALKSFEENILKDAT